MAEYITKKREVQAIALTSPEEGLKCIDLLKEYKMAGELRVTSYQGYSLVINLINDTTFTVGRNDYLVLDNGTFYRMSPTEFSQSFELKETE